MQRACNFLENSAAATLSPFGNLCASQPLACWRPQWVWNIYNIDEILTHFDYDIARNLAFTFYTRSNDFNYWNIIEIEKLEIPRITESYIINLRFVLNATAPGNVKEIPF